MLMGTAGRESIQFFRQTRRRRSKIHSAMITRRRALSHFTKGYTAENTVVRIASSLFAFHITFTWHL